MTEAPAKTVSATATGMVGSGRAFHAGGGGPTVGGLRVGGGGPTGEGGNALATTAAGSGGGGGSVRVSGDGGGRTGIGGLPGNCDCRGGAAGGLAFSNSCTNTAVVPVASRELGGVWLGGVTGNVGQGT
jgi:hypothetical protein